MPAPGEARGVAGDARVEHAWRALAEVLDPEIPVLSVVDLGIVRDVRSDGVDLEVVITPTYSGCPATRVIEQAVRAALDAAGLAQARIVTELHPPWTTDWLSDAGREKLRAYGIAPPPASSDKGALVGAAEVACPRCGCTDTERVSEFGSTPCKAHYKCRACLEPFDYFKCL